MFRGKNKDKPLSYTVTPQEAEHIATQILHSALEVELDSGDREVYIEFGSFAISFFIRKSKKSRRKKNNTQ